MERLKKLWEAIGEMPTQQRLLLSLVLQIVGFALVVHSEKVVAFFVH